MDRRMLLATAVIFLLGAAFATYVFWQYNHPKPEIVLVKNPPAPLPLPPPAPPTTQVTEMPAVQPPLPQLEKSDSFMLDALVGLVRNQSLMKLFHSDLIIHNIVVTIVNLPQQRVPVKVMPFKPPSGRFLTAGSEGHLTISPKNASRYMPYVKLAEAVDAQKLVALYVRLYPLFQQTYEELGYPNDNFNDQLNETLDDLLDTPDIKGPIKLVQPKYFYLYADPDMEALSIGQKIMLRLGSKNVKIIRNKLYEIKQELSRLGLSDL